MNKIFTYIIFLNMKSFTREDTKKNVKSMSIRSYQEKKKIAKYMGGKLLHINN